MISGTHDFSLVALSILVAMVASFTALDLAARTNAAINRRGYIAWLTAAAFAMGGGIWSMHFVAMLAHSMPGMEAYYDPLLTAISFLVAVLVTGFGFAVVSRSRGIIALLGSGLLMGLGIVAMHYTGMAAMRMPIELSYDAVWVAISVFIAIGASIAALWLAFEQASPVWKAGAAIAMGLAISGMHYAGMRAASFSATTTADHAHGTASFGQTNLALIVAATTLFILFLAMLAAMFDRRFAELAAKEAMALRRSEEQFRALYRRTPLPLHALDAQGNIEEVSDAWLDLLGYGRTEVVGQSFFSFLAEPDAERLRSDWTGMLQAQEPVAHEIHMGTKRGDTLTVVSTSRVEREENIGFLRITGGLTDLTARKRAEEALVQLQKMEAIGQLTGGVAHDFNNLLAVVLGNLELLQRRLPDDERLKRMVANAMEGARRGAALTQRMLSFARKQDLRTESVNVPNLIAGMEDLLQRSIGPRIAISTNSNDNLPSARVDPQQLELALLNLVVNARDAMPEGGSVVIGVGERTIDRSTADLRAGTYICISVRDSGSGMDANTLAKAREPFFTTKGVGKGTGLGLSMVHGFAAQSGGELLLHSQLGHGTTAEILLPVAQHAAVETIKLQQPVATDVHRSLAILAVDDDPLVLMNTVELLLERGHRVISATSGTEALETLGKSSFDLLITDQTMPGMTGLDLARAAKSSSPDLPIIIATGHAEIADGNANFPVLNKPYSQAQLDLAIERVMVGATA
jgi:PAS domain S-box-containing protein